MQTRTQRRRSPVHYLALCAFGLALTALACATFRAPGDPAPTRPPTLTPVPTLSPTTVPTATPTVVPTATPSATASPTATPSRTPVALPRTATLAGSTPATPSPSAQ